MYSSPGVAVEDDQERRQFEGELKAYHAQRDAEAMQLTSFIFAASAAMICERRSLQADIARLEVGIVNSSSGQPNLASVLLRRSPLRPSFVVPAVYFYVLGTAMPTNALLEERYSAAILTREDVALKTFRSYRDIGLLEELEQTSTTDNDLDVSISKEQAARRLHALGLTSGLSISMNLDEGISDVVQHWLDFRGPSSDLGAFWAGEAINDRAEKYLEIILRIISADKPELKTEIRMPDILRNNLTVKMMAGLAGVTDEEWRNFFMPKIPPATDDLVRRRANLLPGYTAPGSPAQRTEAFILRLKELFSLPTEVQRTSGADPIAQHPFSGSRSDLLRLFFAQAPEFDLSIDPLDENLVNNTISSLQLGDTLSALLKELIAVLHFLYQITKTSVSSVHGLQFSYMEALYARGFINFERIALLSQSQFQSALAGTVAYPSQVSGPIYIGAMARGDSTRFDFEPNFGFSPINSGDLVNCLPAPNLSPFGLIKYLQDLLNLSISIVDPSNEPIPMILGQIIQARRGDVGGLAPSITNLEANLPVIDMVNESLENLKVQRYGKVWNTSEGLLSELELGKTSAGLNPCLEQVLEAIPEHSLPHYSDPMDPTGVFKDLSIDFSASSLPYNQELDVNRTYLCRIGLNRFQLLRTFREKITEFALNPQQDPQDFRADLWRLPVRLDIAIEYLQISPQELETLFRSPLEWDKLAALYGVQDDESHSWVDELTVVSTFIERTGLSYCEFLQLLESHFFELRTRNEGQPEFPKCPPCCLNNEYIDFPSSESALIPLQELAVFIQLWRKLQQRYCGGSISFSLLGAICQGLGMFENDQINPAFIRNFLALFMLRDIYSLPISLEPGALWQAPPHERVKVLSLWAGSAASDAQREWAITAFLEGVKNHTTKKFNCPPWTGEFEENLTSHLGDISVLSGFGSLEGWRSTPLCTLRMAEILSKLGASPFTIGQVLSIYTNGEHVLGDDPFPYTERSESIEDPLNVPEDEADFGLWSLREKLINVQLCEKDIDCWTWEKIEHALRSDFELTSSHSDDKHKILDPIQTLAEHFFPCQLEKCGYNVPAEKQQFKALLSSEDTTVSMWSAPPDSVFQYRSGMNELWATLPIKDSSFLCKLAHIRQLLPAEQRAVRDLYFAPRAMLAPFALIFANFPEAVAYLVQEDCEKQRFCYFRHQFALFHRRCCILVEHLKAHVEEMGARCKRIVRCDFRLAWKILLSLFADENRGDGQWENDSGELPPETSFKWKDRKFSGGAFAGILGLTGTGLLCEFRDSTAQTIWRDGHGTMSLFGQSPNLWNCPVPTIIASLGTTKTESNKNMIAMRNGFAFNDATAEFLGGAQPFQALWKGVLLVENPGAYRFRLGVPRCSEEVAGKRTCRGCHSHEGIPRCPEEQVAGKGACGGCHDHSTCHDHSGRERACCYGSHLRSRCTLILRRGHKTWKNLVDFSTFKDCNYHEECLSVCLVRGAYDIEVILDQDEPLFDRIEDIQSIRTGLEISYGGPDTQDRILPLPMDKLFIPSKDSRLDVNMKITGTKMGEYLGTRYISTLRDIRRTYQRAFKAIMIASYFQFSAESEDSCRGESEIGHWLKHPKQFEGTSYFLPPDDPESESRGQYRPHHVYFDFNFLPVNDAYYPPSKTEDSRSEPTAKRIAALFDIWERIYDYKSLANKLHKTGLECHRHLWQLFYEASTQSPNPDSLVWHLGIDVSLAPDTMAYYPDTELSTRDLLDERWPIRMRKSWGAIQTFLAMLPTKTPEMAKPSIWASEHPNEISSGENASVSGNMNLVQFVQRALISDNDIKFLKDVQKLNNGLRDRARNALITYWCRMDRVELPFKVGSPPDDHSVEIKIFAKQPSDLSDLLLQNVEVNICTQASRVEDGITVAQSFLHRLRLGLETQYSISTELIHAIDSIYCSYKTWLQFQQRQTYRENWVHWGELIKSRQSEAFRFFETRLPTMSVTMPQTSPGTVLPKSQLPQVNLPNSLIQSVEYGTLGIQRDALDEGVKSMGMPARDGQPSWLAPVPITSVILIPNFPPVEDDDPGDDEPDTDPEDHDIPVILLRSSPTHPVNMEERATMGTNGVSDDLEQPSEEHEAMDIQGASKDKPTPSADGEDLDSKKSMVRAIRAGPVQQVDPSESSLYALQVPLWFQTAVRLGTRFIRIAAAGPPISEPSHPGLSDEDDGDKARCHCSKPHPPVVDEYYFWLTDGSWFDGAEVIGQQDASIGTIPPDTTSDWDRADKLPTRLHWKPKPLVHLAWTRVHLESFDPPRRSSDGVRYEDGIPTLTFAGRTLDSLSFGVLGEVHGFRYDLPTDSAVVLPQTVSDVPERQYVPKRLTSYPYFVYAEPGSPLNPISSFATALHMAGTLRSHCRFQESLLWCQALYNPLNRRNDTWVPCQLQQAFQLDSSVAPRPSRIRGDPYGSYSGIIRSRAVLLEYVETLFQWSEDLMCRKSTEADHHASVLIDLATRILGPKPASRKSDSSVIEKSSISSFSPASAPLNSRLMVLFEQADHMKKDLQGCNRLVGGDGCSDRGGCNELSSCPPLDMNCSSCCVPYRFTSMLAKTQEVLSLAKSLGGGLLSALEKGDNEYVSSLRSAHEKQVLDLSLEMKQNSFRESDWQVKALEKQMQGAQTRFRYYNSLLDRDLITGENTHIRQTNNALFSRINASASEGVGQGMNLIPDVTIGAAGVASSPVNINQIPLGTKLSHVFSAAARIMNMMADNQNTDAGLNATLAGWDRRREEWQHQVQVIGIEIAQIKNQQLAAHRRRDIALRELNNHQEQMQNTGEIHDFVRDKLTKHDLYLFLQQETASLYRQAFQLAVETARDAQKALQFERRDLQVKLPIPSWDNLHSGLMAAEQFDLALQSMHRLYMKKNCREYELTKHFSLRLHFPLAFLQLKICGVAEFEIPEWMFDMDYPGHYLRRIKAVSLTIPCVVGPYVGVHCRLELLSSALRLSPLLQSQTDCCCGSDKDDSLSSLLRSKTSFHSPTTPLQKPCRHAYTSPTGLTRIFTTPTRESESIATSTGQNDAGLFDLSFRGGDDGRFSPFEFAGAAGSRWRIEMPPQNNYFDIERSLSDVVMHVHYTARDGGEQLRTAADLATEYRLPGDGLRLLDVERDWPDLWARVFDRRRRRDGEDGRHRGVGGRHHHKEDHDQDHDHDRHHHHRAHNTTHRTSTVQVALEFSRRMFPFLPARTRKNCGVGLKITQIDVFIDTNECHDVDNCCSSSFSDNDKSNSKMHFTASWSTGSDFKQRPSNTNHHDKHQHPHPHHHHQPNCKSITFISTSEFPGFYHGKLDVKNIEALQDDSKPVLAGNLHLPQWLIDNDRPGVGGVRQVYLLVGYERSK